MVTNYGVHLTVWNLLENKKIVSLPCRSTLLSVLFSSNDRFIGTTSINELSVYDSKNNFSMVSKFYGAENIKVLVSTINADSWFVVNDYLYNNPEIVKYDLTIKPVKKRFTSFTSVYPANAKAAAKFEAVMDEGNDDSWFRKFLSYQATFFILSDKSVFIYKKREREIKLGELPELTSNSKNARNKLFPSVIAFPRRFRLSVDGRYIYLLPDNYFIEPFLIVKLSCPPLVKSIFPEEEGLSFVPVRNGVFVSGEIRKSFTGKDCLYPGIPELWNFGVMQRLASFPELSGTCDCVSVTQDLVACIMPTQVCFFNVLEKTIVARTPFPEHILKLYKGTKVEVIACSSLYHVLMGSRSYAYLLQHADSVDLNSCITKKINLGNYHRTVPCFSPNGQSLAFRSAYGGEILYILDIATISVRGKFSFYFKNLKSELEFVDEEHLLCDGYNDCLCLINVKTCELLTCINLNLGWDFLACRNTFGIVAYDRECEAEFKVIKLWLPQQRKNENELLDCSCLIHGGNIN